MKNDIEHVTKLNNLFFSKIEKKIPNVYLNGDKVKKFYKKQKTLKKTKQKRNKDIKETSIFQSNT